jgi:DNA mismatch repair protein MutS
MLLIDEYIEYCEKYKNIYNNCVVLIQVGDFFELYGVPETKEGVDIFKLCDIMEIEKTRKKVTTTKTKSQPYMAGFPLYIINKYVDILVNNNYTVVIIEQVTPPPKPKREITKIISPSTNIDNNDVNNNFLLSIYFTTIKINNNEIIVASISYIDIQTNESFIYECVENDSQLNLEEVNKIIKFTLKPSEIIVFTDIKTKSNEIIMEKLNIFINSLPNICVHNRLNTLIDDNYFKLSYQKTILSKIFKNTGLLSVIEYIELNLKPLSLISFCYLIQFVYEHSEKILEGLKKPKIMENEKYMLLMNNAVENLNIIPKDNKSNKSSSLLTLLNNCKTPMGKRFFKFSLLNPLTNVENIKKRYEINDFFINNKIYEKAREYLIKISDIERLFKRIIIKNLQPYQFISLYNSLKILKDLDEFLQNNNCELDSLNWNTEYSLKLEEFIKYCDTKFNINNMEKLGLNYIDKNIFNEGIFQELDIMQKEIFDLENIFESVVECLNKKDSDDEILFKLEKNKDNIKIISITKCRFEKVKSNKTFVNNINKNFKNSQNDIVKNLIFNDDITTQPLTPNNKTQFKILFTGMHENQIKLTNLQNKFKTKIIDIYLSELEYFYNKYEELFKKIINFTSLIDFFSCNAYNSKNYLYNRPEILTDENSFIQADSVRHPLIEVIQTDIPYVSNNIEIGKDDEKGILLYGINSVGKSSLMKSIGMNLLMAQCGMFVAAKSFIFSPYNHIFSRMPSGDNLHEGKSTYVCELNELRTILKKSTNKSLVIGDELCSGTEVTSALAIIASGIKTLSEKGCSFIFASHLHELCDLNCIKNIKNINIYHLSVEFDKENNCLIYDRKLKKGNGQTLYGLEIAKSLDLPNDFLHFANQVRQEYTNMNKNFVDPKISKYDNTVYMDKCSLCNENCEEVHHIIQQKDANSENILEKYQIHKNRKSNLMLVCEKCHDRIHNKEIQINGYKNTTEGKKLYFEEIINENISKIEERIKELRNKGNSYAKILNIINTENNNEKITLYKIKKILSIK